ncbi:ion channel [Paraburkholderia megapolitana]|uniref:ion channel n=1 Tax=Paraburkholderia megapolitana TaxID=420953 RepID=UPI0038B90C68
MATGSDDRRFDASASDTADAPMRRRGRRLKLDDRIVFAQGLPMPLWQDLYYQALRASWPSFFVSLAVLFLLLNTAFASLYMLGSTPIANQFPKGFAGAFFFSVETLATVGYGDMHPQTIYAHLVATVEIFIGMSGIALATGLIFARFSRPHAKIMFSRYAIVRMLDGKMTLVVRAANGRQNVIAEAHARLRLMRVEVTPEGYRSRKIRDLALIRDQHPIFQLGWSLMHIIDETSPLYGQTAESLAACDASLLAIIEGSDETTAQTMQQRKSWPAADIRWQYRYIDLMHDEDGVSYIDYSQFDEVVPLEPHEMIPAGVGADVQRG